MISLPPYALYEEVTPEAGWYMYSVVLSAGDREIEICGDDPDSVCIGVEEALYRLEVEHTESSLCQYINQIRDSMIDNPPSVH